MRPYPEYLLMRLGLLQPRGGLISMTDATGPSTASRAVLTSVSHQLVPFTLFRSAFGIGAIECERYPRQRKRCAGITLARGLAGPPAIAGGLAKAGSCSGVMLSLVKWQNIAA